MNIRRLVGAIGWVIGLGATAFGLQWAGEGALAAPPLSVPSQWLSWLEASGPTVAAFSLLRLAAVAGLWYLVATTTIGAVLRVIGAASLVQVADRFTIGPVRRLLAGSVGLGLAASSVIAVAAPALRAPVFAGQQSATATTSTVLPAGLPAVAPAVPPAVAPATLVMRQLAPAEVPRPTLEAPGPPITRPTAPLATTTWTVRPGECFWSIAESILADRSGRAPTDAEIVPYWLRLIEANRHELAQRDNPDLIFPGQVFAVPSP